MSDSIVHERSAYRGVFVWLRDGQRLGYIKYRNTPSHVVIEHTEIGEALRGQGAGRKLVQAVVDWARAEHRTLEPHCEYARSVFDKTPEYADVLAR